MSGDAAAGKTVARELGCVSCHGIDGVGGTGPKWTGLYGREVQLADGSKVTADQAYLERAIRKPATEVREGYAPIMPESKVTDEQVRVLVAYIEALK